MSPISALRRSRRGHGARWFAAVVLVVLVATGCFRMEMRIEVADDGSGTIDVESGIDPDAAEDFAGLLGDFGNEEPQTREQICSDHVEDQEIPEGATVETFDDGDYCGVRYHAELTEENLGEMFEEEGGEFVIERDGEGWRFEAVLDTEDAGTDDEFMALFGELLEDAEFTVAVKLPGRQVEHNADRIDSDGALVWDLDILDPPDRLFARTEPGDPLTGSGGDDGSSVLPWVLAGIAVVLVAGAIGYVVVRRSSTPPSDAPPSDTPPSSGTPPPATPPSGPPPSQ